MNSESIHTWFLVSFSWGPRGSPPWTPGPRGELELKYLREGKEYNILCLTETKQKIEKVKIADGLYNHTMMRETNDKGGGGLQVIGREDRRVDWKEVKGECVKTS